MTVYAAVPATEYLPPTDVLNVNPLELQSLREIATLSKDGYHYKIVEKLKYRNRRDVSNIPIPFPSNFDFAASYPEEAGIVSNDGYKYRAVRRYRLRKRRAAIDLPTGEYLPAEEIAKETAPAHTLDDDGYHYKTVRKLKYRYSRRINGD